MDILHKKSNGLRRQVAEIVLVIFGIFFILDSLFLHLIIFDYGSLAFIDPYFDHWMLGVILISIALISSGKSKVKYVVWSAIMIIILGFLLTPVPICFARETPLLQNVTAEYNESKVKELQEREIIPITTLGQSMCPTITENMNCYCEEKDNYYIGDIVFFHVGVIENGKEYYLGVVHRIIGIENGMFVTKGDNNLMEDKFRVDKSNIICAIPQISRFLVL